MAATERVSEGLPGHSERTEMKMTLCSSTAPDFGRSASSFRHGTPWEPVLPGRIRQERSTGCPTGRLRDYGDGVRGRYLWKAGRIFLPGELDCEGRVTDEEALDNTLFGIVRRLKRIGSQLQAESRHDGPMTLSFGRVPAAIRQHQGPPTRASEADLDRIVFRRSSG